MSNYWSITVVSERLVELIPVIALVGSDCLGLSEVSGEDLPANLGVVGLFHRIMNVDEDTDCTIDEGGWF